MTRIGVGIGVVCLAAASYVSAHAQASQEAPAKQTAPGQSTAAQKDKSKKEGAADEVKVAEERLPSMWCSRETQNSSMQ